MAKIETDSLYATTLSGTNVQAENFNFTGSLILSNDLLADAAQTHNIGAVSGSFNDVYARAISNPDSSSNLQLNSSNGGDIAFTFNGSNTALTLDAANQHLTYNSSVGGGLSIQGTTNTGAATLAGGSDGTESTGARVSCFGNSQGSAPGQLRLYSASTSQPIRFYNGSSHVWSLNAGHLYPSSNSVYDLGTPTTNCRFVYTNVVENSISANALDIVSTNGGGITFDLNGSNLLHIQEDGTFRPTSDGGTDLGTSSLRFGTVNVSVVSSENGASDLSLRAADDIVMRTGGVNRFVLFDPGVFRPNIDSAYSIGTSANKCSAVYSDAFLTFTGLHLYKVKDGESLSSGDAVCIHNQEIKKCDESVSPTCIGIVVTVASGSDLDIIDEDVIKDSFRNSYSTSGTDYLFATVAQCGDNVTTNLPGFKVCDENGTINAGDLLCTASGHPGYLKKWTPDINTINCVVGKCYEDVTFSGGLAENVYGTLQG